MDHNVILVIHMDMFEHLYDSLTNCRRTMGVLCKLINCTVFSLRTKQITALTLTTLLQMQLIFSKTRGPYWLLPFFKYCRTFLSPFPLFCLAPIADCVIASHHMRKFTWLYLCNYGPRNHKSTNHESISKYRDVGKSVRFFPRGTK